MSLLQDLGIGAGFLAVVSAIFGFNNSRINKKQDKDMCATLHGQVKVELKRGAEDFETIHQKLDEYNKTLASLDKSIALLARNSKVRNEH